MKVTIKESEKTVPKSKYPYLGINDRLVVLFFKKDTGTVLKNDSCYMEGDYRGDWLEKYFKPFEGEIILSND